MDTGRAGTVYGQNLDQILGKSWFAKHGFMPAHTYRLEALHTFPTPDFTAQTAGAFAADKSRYTFTASASSRGIAGWNFGANKTKALIILAGLHVGSLRGLLMLNDAQPTTGEGAGAKAYCHKIDVLTGFHDIGRVDAANGYNNNAGYTQVLQANSQYFPAAAHNYGVALYVDTAGGGVIKIFVRIDFCQWVEIASTTGTHLSGVIRCATLLAHPTGATEWHFSTPMGIYAE